MHAVGAGLGDDIHDRRAGAAHLSRETVRGDLELLNCIFRNIQQHAADNVVVVVHAINADVAPTAQLSGGGDHDRSLFRRIEVWCNGIARSQQSEFKKVAPIEWQVVNLLGSDNTVNDGGSRVDEGNGVSVIDGDDSLLLLRAEPHLQRRVLADFHLDWRQVVGEASRRHVHLVSARRKIIQGKETGGVRGRLALLARTLLDRADLGIAHHGALRVGHFPADHAGAKFLREPERSENQKDNKSQESARNWSQKDLSPHWEIPSSITDTRMDSTRLYRARDATEIFRDPTSAEGLAAKR